MKNKWVDLDCGTSELGRPISAQLVTDDKKRTPSNYLYLMAGVHGDEIEGIYVLEKLKESILNLEVTLPPAVFIPTLNVDGHLANTRVNAQGVDLNRNYPTSCWTAQARDTQYNPGPHPLSAPENQFLQALFDSFRPGIILTFHSWKPMLNYNGKIAQPFAEFLQKYNQYPAVDDIEGHPTPGSLGEYVPSRYLGGVLTLEFPKVSDKLTLEQIWAENQSGLEELFKSDLFFQTYDFIHQKISSEECTNS